MAMTKSTAQTQIPIYAPGLRTLPELDNQFFYRAVTETVDDNGLPQLHYQLAESDDANLVFRTTLPHSEFAPTLRPVFVPDYADYESYLLEAEVGGAGLGILSIKGDLSQLTAVLTLAPFAQLSEIAQGRNRGMLQVILPSQNFIQSNFTIQSNGIGEYTYSAGATQVNMALYSADEMLDLKRFFELKTLPGVCYYLYQTLTHGDADSFTGAPKEQTRVAAGSVCLKIIKGSTSLISFGMSVYGLYGAIKDGDTHMEAIYGTYLTTSAIGLGLAVYDMCCGRPRTANQATQTDQAGDLEAQQ